LAHEGVGIQTAHGWTPVRIFSGWVQVGPRRVRVNQRGEFAARMLRRGWVAVHALPPRGLVDVVSSYRMVPPDVDAFDVGELEIYADDI
jgi:hypothetical protein